ncbi:TetR/AcrR family transcriptional regulator [Methanolobus psychrotolerans]|uniref:TetR/AcrR family transcriptional regulator n=1 Tax=Methanolobus psychrotolerans TaxID=1874706 RepID=UPI001A93A7DF|nr:TetR/AcrR family transcriptional regulator [Methanolobus psychrotolerans]
MIDNDGKIFLHVISDPTEVDSDGDGIDDLTENEYGTEPLNPDTDGDKLSDGEEAGVATRTLFHYFKTKEELIETLYLDVKKEAGAVLIEVAGSKVDCMKKLCNVSMAFAKWSLENPSKIIFMQEFCYSPFISTEAQQEGVSNFMFLIDQIKIGINEGWIRDYPPEIVLLIVSSGQMAAILAAVRESDTQKPRDVLEQSIDLILHGILRK